MKQPVKAESILWTGANMAKLLGLLITAGGIVFSIIRYQEAKNNELLLEIKSIKSDLLIYIAQEKGKNDVQDLVIQQQTREMTDVKVRLSKVESRSGLKPDEITFIEE